MVPTTRPACHPRGPSDHHKKTTPHLTIPNVTKLLYHVLKFLFIIYYLISLSYRLSFVPQFTYSTSSSFLGSLVMDYLVDLFFLIDYIAYEYQHYGVHTIVPVDNVAESAEIVSIDFMRNARRNSASSLGEFYVTTSSPLHPSRLLFEVLCLFPMEVVGFVVGYKYFAWLRLNRFIRMCSSLTYWSNIIQALERCGFQTNSAVSRLALCCIFQAVICHVAGCAYYFLALVTMTQGHNDTWLVRDDSLMLDENNEVVYLRPTAQIYIRSIYWSAQALVSLSSSPSPFSLYLLFNCRRLLVLEIFQLIMEGNRSLISFMSISR